MLYNTDLYTNIKVYIQYTSTQLLDEYWKSICLCMLCLRYSLRMFNLRNISKVLSFHLLKHSFLKWQWNAFIIFHLFHWWLDNCPINRIQLMNNKKKDVILTNGYVWFCLGVRTPATKITWEAWRTSDNRFYWHTRQTLKLIFNQNWHWVEFCSYLFFGYKETFFLQTINVWFCSLVHLLSTVFIWVIIIE